MKSKICENFDQKRKAKIDRYIKKQNYQDVMMAGPNLRRKVRGPLPPPPSLPPGVGGEGRGEGEGAMGDWEEMEKEGRGRRGKGWRRGGQGERVSDFPPLVQCSHH